MKKIKSVSEIRKIQLGILKYVHETCEKNGLSYFLCAGTLLGAIRHSGYIPWDDDIDIMMPRKDYERIIRIINADKSGLFRAFTYKNLPELGRTFAKISDTNTIVIQKGFYRIKNLGVNIDIFPIDGLPDSDAEITASFRKISALRKYLYELGLNNGKPSRRVPKWRLPFMFLFCLYMDKIAKKYSAESTGKLACFGAVGIGKTEIIDRGVLEKRILADFENERFYIPQKYDEYLTNHYGNYMQLPPLSQRRNKHGTAAWHKAGRGDDAKQ